MSGGPAVTGSPVPIPPAGDERIAAYGPPTGAGSSWYSEYGVVLGHLRLWVRATVPAAEVPAGTDRAVYVHGLGGSRTNWTTLMRELRGDAVGQAVDLPGFGESPPPDNGDFSVTGFAWAVARFIERGGEIPVHLVGNSLGGAVATRIAALRPDLVRTLTLISPALPNLRLTSGSAPIAALGLPILGSVLNRAYAHGTVEERVRRVLETVYGDPASVSEQGFADAVEEARRYEAHPYASDVLRMTARSLVAEYLAVGPRALWRQAAKVAAPTLLVYGRKDKIVDPRKATKGWRTFPDARLLTLPAAGHLAMMEYPQVVGSAMRQFWRREGHAFFGGRRPFGVMPTGG